MNKAVVVIISTLFLTTIAVGGVLASGDDPDKTVIEIHVGEGGDAVVTIEQRYAFDDTDDEDAFQELATDIEENQNEYANHFEDSMSQVVDSANEDTDREMSIENVRVTTETRTFPSDHGVVVYQFDWVNFAVVEDDTITVADSLNGFFLNEDTNLLISWANGYELVNASPEPDETRETSVLWAGEMEFASNEPVVSLTVGENTGDGENGTDTNNGGSSGGDDDSTSYLLPAIGGLFTVGVVGVGGYFYLTRKGGEEKEATERDDKKTNEETGSGESEPAPISNEEKVIGVIEDHGGRVKQKQLKEELGWSDAKVSRITSDLRDDETISGYRVGRENVLELPDQADDKLSDKK